MGNHLKSENLTISVPNTKGCNKNCPYCISKMTGHEKHRDGSLMYRNFKKVITIAESAEITNVMFTGKGEPTLNMDFLETWCYKFDKFPLELQTNGILLNEVYRKLYEIGINVVAISIDNDEQLQEMEYQKIFEKMREIGLVSRITVNITDMLDHYRDFGQLIDYCKRKGVHQLTLRKVVSSEGSEGTKQNKWIERHGGDEPYDKIKNQVSDYIDGGRGRLIKQLTSGVKVYDIDGVSFVTSDYCIQERSNGDDTRSLIYLEDGHLYTSWNSKASILF